MPTTKSAKKAMRSSARKQAVNTARKYKVKNAMKDLRKATAAEAKDVQTKLSAAFAQLDKAVKSNIIPKGRANRKKSRLAKMVDALNKQ